MRPLRSATGRRIGCIAGMLLFAASALAQVSRDEPTEASVKAAFLYKFAGYVEWPAHAAAPESPFTIGVIDDDAVASELERIVPGRTIAGHPIAVRGQVQREGRVVHVLARHLEDLSPLLGRLATASHDFH